MQLDGVLADLERAGATISAKKSYFGQDRLEVVGYEISAEGRFPNARKASKIADWPACRNVREVRGFIGLAVYYRIWVFCFAIIAKPLFLLLKDEVEFHWAEAQERAMQTIKDAITSAPALASIDYTSGGQIYLMVDASAEGGGACIEQVGHDGKRHPCRFESTAWSKTESNWHSTKLEAKALLWALKKFRT